VPDVRRTLWTIALFAGLFWPARALGAIDGLPLNGAFEATTVGVLIPCVWILHGELLDARWARVAIAALLALKISQPVLLTGQGLCAQFSTTPPFHSEVLTIPIDEPRGMLRSWDVRADWRREAPRCTAIIDRAYDRRDAFPAWFTNVIEPVAAADIARRDTSEQQIEMRVRGVLTVPDRGRLTIDTGPDIALAGVIGSETITQTAAAPASVALTPGAHRIDVRALLRGDRWRFVPAWNGRDAFRSILLTTGEPSWLDRSVGPFLRFSTTLIAVSLAGGWIAAVIHRYRRSAAVLVWVAVASVLLAGAANGRLERLAPATLVFAAFVPIASEHRNWRGAFLLAGVPWLVFSVVRSLPEIGRFSVYSPDDWLAYQVAGYRIYMNGYWLQGGSATFDYQPLYRWIAGALHLAFGDSSVGELYWDAGSLLAGGLAAYALVEPVAGFRFAVAAAAVTLATFTASTIWYFAGRGLSEISAAGFAFFTVFALLRARTGSAAAAGLAGALATLMFYTRLNHLLFAGFLLAVLLLPSAGDRPRGSDRAQRGSIYRAALVYSVVFAVGVMAFALRTWWYTGVFSVLQGTSLANNDTGLRMATIGSGEVWRRVGHSIAALVWMNEPPAADVRAIPIVAGVLLSLLALVRAVRSIPAGIAWVTIGAGASALFVHTHNYPGRMSIHLVPFAVSALTIAASRIEWPVLSRPREYATADIRVAR
jgi:hypothetical protein